MPKTTTIDIGGPQLNRVNMELAALTDAVNSIRVELSAQAAEDLHAIRVLLEKQAEREAQLIGV